MTGKVKTSLIGVAIVALTVLAYAPAGRAGFIWDDPDHILNNPTLRSLDGLVEMWTNRHALPQWYPLVHTSFWIEYQLWGTRPAGYHVTNVLLHACSAVILWRLLGRLQVPGALFAACLFAVHPVHVESVAWVTERKNVLSGAFYLLSMSAYLRAIGRGEGSEGAESGATLRSAPAWGWYSVALLLFVGALFSKTVTASLPAAILLIIWWQTGRIRLRDVALLVPFFVIGLILALHTAQLEQIRVGAAGDEWKYGDTKLLDLLARTIIAGKALWFYAWKLVWPVDLAFIYERWTIDPRDLLKHLYPISFMALVVGLYLMRRRIGRGPVVAVLFFAGTLVPALGFFNVFPHRYAFVADHFQYHASIGLIALAAALLTRVAERLQPPVRVALAAVLVGALAVMTFARSRVYEDPITLWTDTVEKSPNNWMPWTNLGNALAAEKRYREAIPHYERALELAPEVDDVQYNAGHARARQGRYREAEDHFLRAVAIKPTYLPAWESLGDLYADELNEPEKAIEAYRRASEIAPWLPGPKLKMQRLKRQMSEP